MLVGARINPFIFGVTTMGKEIHYLKNLLDAKIAGELKFSFSIGKWRINSTHVKMLNSSKMLTAKAFIYLKFLETGKTSYTMLKTGKITNWHCLSAFNINFEVTQGTVELAGFVQPQNVAATFDMRFSANVERRDE